MFRTVRRTLLAAAVLAAAVAPEAEAQRFRSRPDRVLATSPHGGVILVSDTTALMAPIHQFVRDVNSNDATAASEIAQATGKEMKSQALSLGGIQSISVRGDMAQIVVPARLEHRNARGQSATRSGELAFTLHHTSDGWRVAGERWVR